MTDNRQRVNRDVQASTMCLYIAVHSSHRAASRGDVTSVQYVPVQLLYTDRVYTEPDKLVWPLRTVKRGR